MYQNSMLDFFWARRAILVLSATIVLIGVVFFITLIQEAWLNSAFIFFAGLGVFHARKLVDIQNVHSKVRFSYKHASEEMLQNLLLLFSNESEEVYNKALRLHIRDIIKRDLDQVDDYLACLPSNLQEKMINVCKTMQAEMITNQDLDSHEEGYYREKIGLLEQLIVALEPRLGY